MHKKSAEEARREAYNRQVDETDDLMRSMVGRWGDVLSTLIPGMDEAVRKGGRGHVACPITNHASSPRASSMAQQNNVDGNDAKAKAKRRGGESKNFRISHKDFRETGKCFCTCRDDMSNGFRVIMARYGCDFVEAKRMVQDTLGRRDIRSAPARIEYVKKSDAEVAKADERIRAHLRRVWSESLSLEDERAAAARAWFRVRCVEGFSGLQKVRFHPALDYFESQTVNGEPRSVKVGTFPGLVCRIEHADGTPVTIHRTFLASDGTAKAAVECPRKVIAQPSDVEFNGSAIRLDGFKSKVLAVGEGLESALSARDMLRGMDIPVWSTVNANGMRALELPDWAEILVVFGDRDRSQEGQSAAFELVKRARQEGLRATCLLPRYAIPEDKKGVDWNDVAMALQPNGARLVMDFLQWQRRLKAVLRESSETGISGRMANA